MSKETYTDLIMELFAFKKLNTVHVFIKRSITCSFNYIFVIWFT